MRLAKLAFTVVVLAALVYYLADNWGPVRAAWDSLTWHAMSLSALAVLLGLGASSMAWREAARDIGSDITFFASARVFMIGQLAKYVPGTVWVYLLQTELGRRAGVPRNRALLVSMMCMVIGIVAAVIIGVASLPVLIVPATAGLPYVAPVRAGLLCLAVASPCALVVIIPRVLTSLIALLLRVTRRPPLEAPLTWGGVLRMLLWSTVTWLCYGTHLLLLFGTEVGAGPVAYLRCTGAIAVAVAVGMFFPTPSGVGGREGLLVAILAPVVAAGDPAGLAFGVAWASRMIFFVAEIVAAGMAALTDLHWPDRWRDMPEGSQDADLRLR